MLALAVMASSRQIKIRWKGATVSWREPGHPKSPMHSNSSAKSRAAGFKYTQPNSKNTIQNVKKLPKIPNALPKMPRLLGASPNNQTNKLFTTVGLLGGWVGRMGAKNLLMHCNCRRFSDRVRCLKWPDFSVTRWHMITWYISRQVNYNAGLSCNMKRGIKGKISSITWPMVKLLDQWFLADKSQRKLSYFFVRNWDWRSQNSVLLFFNMSLVWLL